MRTVTSVGASGGLMGWLGFLLVIEPLHGKLVPRSSRHRLIAGVLLTALVGLVGYRFIDNAAHAGGLLAGMFYAAIVFPKSSSPSTLTDRIAGIAAIAVLAAAFAILRMVFQALHFIHAAAWVKCGAMGFWLAVGRVAVDGGDIRNVRSF